MQTRVDLLLLFTLLLCCPAGAREPVRLRWSDLPRELAGRPGIAMVLPDSARVAGRFVAVRPDALVLDISRTSDRQAHPKGRLEIPRASVREFQVTRLRLLWRAVLTPLATVVAFPVAYILAWSAGNSAEGVAVLAFPAAAGFAVYYAAKRLDRKTTTVTVLPEP